MRSFRVLINEPAPERWRTLEGQLNEEAQFEVVGRVRKPVDLLLAVLSTEANVVVLFNPEEGQGIMSHLFAEYPELTVLILGPTGNAFIRQRCPSQWAVADTSFSGLVTALRNAVNEPCILAGSNGEN